MLRFEVRESKKFRLTSTAGTGTCREAAQVELVIDPKLPVLRVMPSSDVVRSIVDLLSLGKSDFEAIEPFREAQIFRQALSLRNIPGSARMRQRPDARGAELHELIDELSLRLLGKVRTSLPASRTDWQNYP
jgi:hypothetical protein